jgi:hypothetical protein
LWRSRPRPDEKHGKCKHKVKKINAKAIKKELLTGPGAYKLVCIGESFIANKEVLFW